MIVRSIPGFTLTISELPWDSEMFGFACAHFDISRSGAARATHAGLPGAIAEVLQQARSEAVKFVTLKTDAEETETVNSALRNNGSLIDTELTFAKKPTAPDTPAVPESEYSIQKMETFWDDSLYDLTSTLQHSRFFVDSHIDADVAHRIWRTSIYNHCNGRASYSVVAHHRDKPIGLMNVVEKNGISDIFLIAVSPPHQGKGVGSAMMDLYEATLGAGTETQIVETQLRNYGAHKFYHDRGYRAVRSKHTIHFWL
jgi:GNAT superfamily N-acetyltransferase